MYFAKEKGKLSLESRTHGMDSSHAASLQLMCIEVLNQNKKASRNWEEHEFAKLVYSFGGVLYQLHKRTSGRFYYMAANTPLFDCRLGM
jgi:hypothetical protein